MASTLFLTAIAMLAFAGNSLLCRLALKHTSIDATTFTCVRLIAGAITLWLLVRLRNSLRDNSAANKSGSDGNWPSACALFVYAIAFSFAYTHLSTATGALLLFGAVQASMISYGLWRGERLRGMQLIGLTIAVAGVVGLMAPGLAAPSPFDATLMLSAGIAWGVYSLRGKSATDPTRVTAGNFLRAVLIAVTMTLLMYRHITIDMAGIAYAIASGAITSGIGYAIWYTALPSLKATHAASVQLSVPVIAAIGGIVLLGEPLTLRLVLASVAILGGIGLVIGEKRAVIAVPVVR